MKNDGNYQRQNQLINKRTSYANQTYFIGMFCDIFVFCSTGVWTGKYSDTVISIGKDKLVMFISGGVIIWPPQ